MRAGGARRARNRAWDEEEDEQASVARIFIVSERGEGGNKRTSGRVATDSCLATVGAAEGRELLGQGWGGEMVCAGNVCV